MTFAIVNCGELVTLRGAARPRTGAEMQDLAIVREGAVLVRDGRIAAVGSYQAVSAQIPSGCEVIDARNRTVLPGFVDAHTHAVFAGTRANEMELRSGGWTYQQIAAEGGGIRSTVRATRAASEDELVAAGSRYAAWFLRCGTTTIECKSGYGLTVADELKLLRAIRRLNQQGPLRYVPTLLGAHAVPDEFRNDRAGYIRLVTDDMIPQAAQERLAEYCDVFCEEGAFTQTEAELILTTAARHGLRPRIHADQLTAGEGAQLAARVDAATADHLEYTGPEAFTVLRDAGVQPVLLPASVFALGSTRYPQARAMIDAGLAVVLATDFNPGTSPTPSMPFVMTLAVTHMQMSFAEALTAATINAAYSLNRGTQVGSIEPGKAADLVLYDVHDHRDIAYFFGLEHAAAVWAGGTRVFGLS